MSGNEKSRPLKGHEKEELNKLGFIKRAELGLLEVDQPFDPKQIENMRKALRALLVEEEVEEEDLLS